MKYTLLKNKATGARSILVAGSSECDGFQVVRESEEPLLYADLRKRAIANRNRAERDQVMRDLGLVKTPYGWE